MSGTKVLVRKVYYMRSMNRRFLKSMVCAGGDSLHLGVLTYRASIPTYQPLENYS
jgi:hypothetical protein